MEKRARFSLASDYQDRMAELTAEVSVIVGSSNFLVSYYDVNYLRDQLELWMGELKNLTSTTRDFPNTMVRLSANEGQPEEVPLIDAAEYLDRLIRMYDDNIRICSRILQTAGMAFQTVSFPSLQLLSLHAK